MKFSDVWENLFYSSDNIPLDCSTSPTKNHQPDLDDTKYSAHSNLIIKIESLSIYRHSQMRLKTLPRSSTSIKLVIMLS